MLTLPLPDLSLAWWDAKRNIRKATAFVKSRVRRPLTESKNTEDKAIQQSHSKLYASLPGVKPRPSPIPHLLLSNDTPSDVEIPLVLDCISQAEAEAERLAGILMAWEDPATGLSPPGLKHLTKLKLESETRFINQHKGALSSIRCIPSEILQLIFFLSHNREIIMNRRSHKMWRRVSSLPFNVSQVCAFWRRTALSTPTLWNHIPSIDLDDLSTTSPRYLDFLADILSRCGRAAPLHLHISGPRYVGDTHPAIRLLTPLSMNWEVIVIELPCFNFSSLFDGIKGRLASLKTVTIPSWRSGDDPHRDLNVTVDVFEEAPRLCEIGLYGTRFGRFLIPDHQIINFCAEDCHPDQYNGLVDFSSSLIRLTIIQNMGFPIPSSIVSLTNLTILEIDLDFGGNDLLLFGSLTLPALEELSLRARGYINVVPHVSAMILRSSHQSVLKKIHIDSWATSDPGEMTNLLQQTPLLTHLYVNIPSADDLKRLIPTKGDTLAPLLQVCALNMDGTPDDEQVALLRRLAIARCEIPRDLSSDYDGPVQRLHGLYLLFNHQPEPIVVSHRWQQALEYWKCNSAVSSILIDHVAMITVYLSDLYDIPSHERINFDGIPGLYSIGSILKSLENMEISCEEIYGARILQALYRLTTRYEFEGNGLVHKYGHMAQSIINKWKPLLEATLPNFHWTSVTTFLGCLFYISDSSPLRESPDPLRVILTGVKEDDIPKVCLSWPNLSGI